jgi:2',3'-cyclic-nucleotide 2'-phosphodiesterase / 3'-nucleotidase
LNLRILATTDLHANLMPFDYHADQPDEMAGLVRTASLIRAARSEVSNTLLLDNGDMVQGTALGDYIAASAASAAPCAHPMIAAMNALGYDAGTLGNHEFSHGLPVLETILRDAAFPIVSANMLRQRGETPETDVGIVAPYVLLPRDFADSAGRMHRLNIGIVGVAPPQVLTWDHPHVSGRLQARDMVQAVASAVPRMRKAGADVIVVLAHTGFGSLPATDGMENAGLALADLPGVDAIVLGHAHQVFPSSAFAHIAGVDARNGLVRGKPAVMPGMFGSHLGVMDLTLEQHDGIWRVTAGHSQVMPIATRDACGRPVALVPDDPETASLAAPVHGLVRAGMQRPIGYSAQPLHSYFALVSDSAAMRVVAQAQAFHLRHLLAGTAHADLPVISSVAPFKAGGRAGPDCYTDIPPGPLSVRHAFDLYIHPNTFAALLVTGDEVAEWLERAVTVYHQIAPGARDAALINPDVPAFTMEMLSGVTYTVDLSAPARYDAKGVLCDPAARRIRNLCHRGQPVTPAARFALATNSFRAWVYAAQAAQPVNVLVEGHEMTRDVLTAHLARGAPLPQPGWHIAPLPGASVTLDCAPRAIAHAGDMTRFHPQPLGLTAEGFQRFRLHL